MYGLVNRAIEGLVISQAGETAWKRVRQRAGMDDDSFISLENYPDEVTYRLVGAASEVLGRSPEAILEGFGEYWTLYTAQEGYGEMLRSYGSNLREFLDNLNAMHGRIELIYEDMKLPHFEVSDDPDGALRLHYRSTRTGLAPMVIGLVRGLTRLLDEPMTIEHVRRVADGADHDEFVLRAAAAA